MTRGNSNVECVSNVYVIEGEFHNDTRFRGKVRGRDNIYAMLKALAGLSWVSGHVSVDSYADKYLTKIQRDEWELGKYCALLGDSEEKVWGIVKTPDGLEIKCRCYKTECSHFKSCRPNYPDDAPAITAPESLPEPEERKIEPLPLPEEKISISELDRKERNKEVLSGHLKVKFEFEPEVPVAPTREPFSTTKHETASGGQEKIIKSMPDEHILVQAGPGAGKTYSLLRKLEYMVDEKRMIEADSILVLCFTRAAVQEIKERFHAGVESGKYSDDLSRLFITTFDSFATQVLIARDVDMTGTDYDTRIEMVIDEIKQDPDILIDVKHLIVDEIQDLVGVRARLVKTILSCKPEDCGFTLLGDPLQGIYDYQVKDTPGEMDARGLLEWVRYEFSNSIKVINIAGNYRQTGKLVSFTTDSRRSLEAGTEEAAGEFLRIINTIPSCGKDYNFLLPLSEENKTAVLCRTNGEALKISGYLRQRGIRHILRREHSFPLLPIWIVELLTCDSMNLTREQLSEITINFNSWPEGKDDLIYNSLRLLGEQKSERVLNINNVRRCLANGSRLPDEFYEQEMANITVSTIHRSKGREYDEVYLLPPWEGSRDGELFEEAKVYYVAITRAREKLHIIERSAGRNWLKKSERTERWTERGKKRSGEIKLIAVEVGMEYDVDEQGFVDEKLVGDAKENQEYLRKRIKPGDRIDIKLEDETGIYLMYHNRRLIGKMSEVFMSDIRQIMREVYVSSSHVPRALEDIYVDRIYSVVKKPETIRPSVAEPYLSNGVWYGVSLVGLGKIRWPWDC